LLSTALSLQPKAGAGAAGKGWGETLEEIAKDISERVPAPFDVEAALILFPVLYEESMNTVLTQELIRFNRLTDEVSATLKELQKAIKGLVVLSAELEQMGHSMVLGRVPSLWARVAYPSLKPLGAWVFDLLDRLTFLDQWVHDGRAPNVFWISGFFFTQAFITGTLQNFARKYKIPIDRAEFDFAVLSAAEAAHADTHKVEDGAAVRGLFLEGARWDPHESVLAGTFLSLSLCLSHSLSRSLSLCLYLSLSLSL